MTPASARKWLTAIYWMEATLGLMLLLLILALAAIPPVYLVWYTYYLEYNRIEGCIGAGCLRGPGDFSKFFYEGWMCLATVVTFFEVAVLISLACAAASDAFKAYEKWVKELECLSHCADPLPPDPIQIEAKAGLSIPSETGQVSVVNSNYPYRE